MIVIKGELLLYSTASLRVGNLIVFVWMCVFFNVFLPICATDSGVFACVIELKIFLKEPHFVCAFL